MASPAGQKQVFCFGLFEADPASGELTRKGEAVRLQEQPFRMLLLLLERAGEVVTREELREKLWPENSFGEFDNGLNVAVRKIREALGDSAEAPRFVQTIPKQGYRFIAPVAAKSVSPSDEVQTAAPASRIVSKAAYRIRHSWALLGTAVIVLGACTALIVSNQRKPQRASLQPSSAILTAPRRSVAVITFQNNSSRRADDWLQAAIPEMLSTELAAGEKLRLIPGEDVVRMTKELNLQPSSSLARETAIRVGRNLSADVVVTGSFTSAAQGRLRIDIRLQDARNGEILGEMARSGNAANVFDLISAVGSAVREHLGVGVTSPQEETAARLSLPQNHEAARLYTEGISRLRVMDGVGARDLLTNALAADPSFPLSHMALASAWRLLGYDQKALAEVRKAKELASGLPMTERLRIDGRLFQWSGEVDKAIASFRSLMALLPDSLEDGLLLAETQTAAGHRNDALATLESLRRLPEPLASDPRIDLDRARLYNDNHEYLALAQRAEEKARAHEVPLLAAKAQIMQCSALQTLGQEDEAARVCDAALRVFSQAGNLQDVAQTVRFLGDIRLHQGKFEEALQLFQQSLATNQRCGDDRGVAVSSNEMALVYESRGDYREAEKLYLQAYRLFLKVGHRHNAAVLAFNVGGAALEQGRLARAEQLFLQSQNLAREVGDQAAEFGAYDGLAALAFLRGDLKKSQQYSELSLAKKKEAGEKFEYVQAILILLDTLEAQGDLAQARKKADEARKMAEELGSVQQLANIKMNMAEFDTDEGHVQEAEATLRETLKTFLSEKARDDEIQARCSLAVSLLSQGRATEAAGVLEEVRDSNQWQNIVIKLHFAITKARVKAALGGDSQLRARIAAELQSVMNEARRLGLMPLEYEARLAYAQLAAQFATSSAKTQAASLAEEAHEHGFELVSKQAAQLLR